MVLRKVEEDAGDGGCEWWIGLGSKGRTEGGFHEGEKGETRGEVEVVSCARIARLGRREARDKRERRSEGKGKKEGGGERDGGCPEKKTEPAE